MAKAPPFTDAPRLLGEALYALNTQGAQGCADQLGRGWSFWVDPSPPVISLRLELTVYGDEDGPVVFRRSLGQDALGADDAREGLILATLASLDAEARAPRPSLLEGAGGDGAPPTTPGVAGA